MPQIRKQIKKKRESQRESQRITATEKRPRGRPRIQPIDSMSHNSNSTQDLNDKSNDETKDMWKRAENIVSMGMTVNNAAKLVELVRQMLIIKVMRKDFFARIFSPPSTEVDEAWHAIILETELYEEICMTLSGKRMIHHRISGALDDEKEKSDRRERMRQEMTRVFGTVFESDEKKESNSEIEAKKEVNNEVNKELENEVQQEKSVENPRHNRCECGFPGDRYSGCEFYGSGISLFVKDLSGRTHTIDCCRHITVLYLKGMIRDKTTTPIDIQRLIYAGKTLDNNKRLSDYGIKQESLIHVLSMLRGC